MTQLYFRHTHMILNFLLIFGLCSFAINCQLNNKSLHMRYNKKIIFSQILSIVFNLLEYYDTIFIYKYEIKTYSKVMKYAQIIEFLCECTCNATVIYLSIKNR